MRGKFLRAILLGTLATVGLGVMSWQVQAADKPGNGMTVCISLDKVNASREGQLKFWRKAADELGIKLIEQVAGEDAQRQSSQVDTCIAQKVSAIVSIPWDPESVMQDIDRAHAANIPFITMDQQPADLSTVDFHIGAAPLVDGMHGGQRLAALVGDKPTKVVVLQGALNDLSGQGRDKGFKDGIKDHPNIKIVSEIPTDWHPEPVLAGMENALQANPDLDAVWVPSDGLLPPVWSALQKANRYTKVGAAHHVIVLSVDGDPQGCAAVSDGWADAGYAQAFPLMTRKTLEVAIDIVKNGKKPTGDDRTVLVPSTEYMLSNLAQTKSDVWGCTK
jgi:ABC-type sugar transport system substrate-binding protein